CDILESTCPYSLNLTGATRSFAMLDINFKNMKGGLKNVRNFGIHWQEAGRADLIRRTGKA
ncbi:MAG: hypothetical protein IJQ29_02520, partial [Synergistaceae bacterium]|nr:hypothetical protein [Synergistaceae bacterium]